MSYEPSGLQALVPGMSNTGNTIWALNTTDSAANVNTANYISDGLTRGMTQGEIVYVKTRSSLPTGNVTAVNMMWVAQVGTGADGLGVDLTDGTAITATDSD